MQANLALDSKPAFPQQNPGYAPDRALILIKLQAEASEWNLNLLNAFDGV